MFTVIVSDEIKQICPSFSGAALYACIENSEYSEQLWNKINECVSEYRSNNTIEDVKTHPVVAATRNAYKKAGKDPNRYRPSSEALCRRIVRNIPLYQIDTLVDIINLVSIQTGYAIGGFDADKISGNTLTLGIGKADEPYEAIGRGSFNIEGLPVYRDNIGGIGTPSSDHERSKLNLQTTHLLAIINGYNGEEGLEDAVNLLSSLLHEFADARQIEITYFK